MADITNALEAAQRSIAGGPPLSSFPSGAVADGWANVDGDHVAIYPDTARAARNGEDPLVWQRGVAQVESYKPPEEQPLPLWEEFAYVTSRWFSDKWRDMVWKEARNWPGARGARGFSTQFEVLYRVYDNSTLVEPRGVRYVPEADIGYDTRSYAFRRAFLDRYAWAWRLSLDEQNIRPELLTQRISDALIMLNRGIEAEHATAFSDLTPGAVWGDIEALTPGGRLNDGGDGVAIVKAAVDRLLANARTDNGAILDRRAVQVFAPPIVFDAMYENAAIKAAIAASQTVIQLPPGFTPGDAASRWINEAEILRASSQLTSALAVGSVQRLASTGPGATSLFTREDDLYFKVPTSTDVFSDLDVQSTLEAGDSRWAAHYTGASMAMEKLPKTHSEEGWFYQEAGFHIINANLAAILTSTIT